ncbi:MAG: T9SS type A sorting domain-containing protein [Tunicatimonas sp.]
MRKLLRVAYAKGLVILSFSAYAQSEGNGSPTNHQEKKSAKKAAIAQVSSPTDYKTEKNRSTVPDIRRQVAGESVTLYPNPVVDQLLVEVDLDRWQGGTLTIKSKSGRKVVQQPISEAAMGFNLSSLNRGVYRLTVRKGGAEKTVEVIKM